MGHGLEPLSSTNNPSARFDWTNRGEVGRFFRAIEKQREGLEAKD